MTIRTRSPGEFCWINMLSPDLDAARGFYTAVLGWTFVEMPGMGYRVQAGGRDIGGLFDLLGPNTPAGTKPQVGVMVKVASADATVERIKALGGTATPAWDIGPAGRMSVCGDPAGAKFDLWEAKAMAGFDADPITPGAPGWFELMTPDADRAATFYGELFGWAREATADTVVPYALLKQGAHPVGGMLTILPRMGPLAPNWTTYFTVPDAAKAVAEAEARGAAVPMPVRESASGDRFARLESPQGVPFAVIEHGETRR